MAAVVHKPDLSPLEKRIRDLEEAVGKSHQGEKDAESCAAVLSKIAVELHRATATKEHITQFFSKQNELKTYLNPQLEKTVALTPKIKTELIAASETQVKRTANLLMQVESLKDTLDPKTLKSLPQLSDRLQPLMHAHVEQQDGAEAISKELADLLKTYNNFVSTVSHQLDQWDRLLQHYEEQYR
ncbi:dynactin subunit 3-like [Oscarella lobularis]|uniref:dynactin subunit 3-like n=1 Tax=Oscarella lobularis TaxID=121494 RepID=UPI0033133AD0